MKIFRGNVPAGEFTLITNQVWTDTELSSHAVRILGFLLSLPNEWQTDRFRIMKATGISDYHYRKAWDQLRERKYVRQWRESSGDWFVTVSSVVTESHVTQSHVSESHVDRHHVLERRTSSKTDEKKTVRKKRVVRRRTSGHKCSDSGCITCERNSLKFKGEQ